MEISGSPVYLKINCMDQNWPLKLKCVSVEGEYSLYISFEYIIPDHETNILQQSNKKEHLYKFKKPKLSSPEWCYICIRGQEDKIAKLEIKYWFTDPQIEKWR